MGRKTSHQKKTDMGDKAKPSESGLIKIIISLSRVVNIIAMVSLSAMMLLTVLDVFLRYIFKRPIADSFELTEYLMVCTGAFALAWCAAKGGHIRVDLVVSRFSPRVQAVLDGITHLFGLGICSLIAWRSLSEALVVRKTTTLLGVPAYPFYLVLTLGFALLCLVMVAQLIEYLCKAVRK